MRPPSPSVADATASSAWKRSSAVGPFRRTVTTATPSASRFPAYRPFIIAGEARHCLPGQCHILHPDDWRDGAPGNDEGIAYRIVYIDPSLIQAALNGQALPFVPDLVIDLTDAQRRAMTVHGTWTRQSTTRAASKSQPWSPSSCSRIARPLQPASRRSRCRVCCGLVP